MHAHHEEFILEAKSDFISPNNLLKLSTRSTFLVLLFTVGFLEGLFFSLFESGIPKTSAGIPMKTFSLETLETPTNFYTEHLFPKDAQKTQNRIQLSLQSLPSLPGGQQNRATKPPV